MTRRLLLALVLLAPAGPAFAGLTPARREAIAAEIRVIDGKIAEAESMRATLTAHPDDYDDVARTLQVLGETLTKLNAAKAALVAERDAPAPPPAAPPAVAASAAAAPEPATSFAWFWRGKEASLGKHSDAAVDVTVFEREVGASTLERILHERDARTGARSSGPEMEWRYVRDPAAPGRVIDMRHFLAIGSKRRAPELLGLGVELVQWISSKNPALSKRQRASFADTAFDPQDFYSNALGARFFREAYKPGGAPLGEQVAVFLKKRGEDHAAH